MYIVAMGFNGYYLLEKSKSPHFYVIFAVNWSKRWIFSLVTMACEILARDLLQILFTKIAPKGGKG